MSQRILTVNKKITEITGVGSHRLQMWVSLYQDIEPEVFVWQRRPAVPPAVVVSDEYVNIASAADMVEYPIDNPDPDLPPFYRKSSIDVLFRSVDLMNTSIDIIEADLRNLITNLDYLAEQGDETQIVIEGELFSESSESSDSSSDSSESSDSSSDSSSST